MYDRLRGDLNAINLALVTPAVPGVSWIDIKTEGDMPEPITLEVFSDYV